MSATKAVEKLSSLFCFCLRNAYRTVFKCLSKKIALAIATLSDRLKNLALVFQPMRSKTIRTVFDSHLKTAPNCDDNYVKLLFNTVEKTSRNAVIVLSSPERATGQ